MKTLYWYILTLIISSSCSHTNFTDKNCEDLITQGIIDSFQYTIRPGSTEWSTMEQQGKTWEAVNIPNDELQKMCTRGLVYTCVYCPLFSNLVVYNDIRTGFNSLSDNINSFNELRTRHDAGRELLTYYKTLLPEDLSQSWETSRKLKFQVQFYLTEIFFAQQEYLSMLNNSELNSLLLDSYKKLINKEVYRFDLESINSSYALISNLLYHNLNYTPLIDYCNRNKLDPFLDDFKVIDKETTDSLRYYIQAYISENSK